MWIAEGKQIQKAKLYSDLVKSNQMPTLHSGTKVKGAPDHFAFECHEIFEK